MFILISILAQKSCWFRNRHKMNANSSIYIKLGIRCIVDFLFSFRTKFCFIFILLLFRLETGGSDLLRCRSGYVSKDLASPSGDSLEESDFSRINPDFTPKARIIA
jgi:hypothetical protein